MKIKVQIVIESDGGETKAVENIACLNRGMLRPAELGLNLNKARALLESVQHTIVEQQVTEYLGQQAYCPCCGKNAGEKAITIPLCAILCLANYNCLARAFFTVGADRTPPILSAHWPGC